MNEERIKKRLDRFKTTRQKRQAYLEHLIHQAANAEFCRQQQEIEDARIEKMLDYLRKIWRKNEKTR